MPFLVATKTPILLSLMMTMLMMKYGGDHNDDDDNVALGYNWVTIELALREISWICPTIYPDIQTTTIYSDIYTSTI